MKLWNKLKGKFEVRLSVCDMIISGCTVHADAYIMIRIGSKRWFPHYYRVVGYIRDTARKDLVEWMEKGTVLPHDTRIAKLLTSTYNDFRMSKYSDFRTFRNIQIANNAMRTVREHSK